MNNNMKEEGKLNLEPLINASLDPVEELSVPKTDSMIPMVFAKKLSDVPGSENKCYESSLECCGDCTGCLGAYCGWCCCCCCSNPYVVVHQGMAGVITKFGKAYKVVDPGLYFVNGWTEEAHEVNIKIRITPVPVQIVMTKDNVSVAIDSVLYWHVIDPFVAKFHVANVDHVLVERTMTTLRDTIGAHDLQNIIENREALAAEIRNIIEEASRSWGVVVEAILLKDLKFSNELQETLAAAAKQQRLGESRVISANAEVKAARLMREASDILNTPAAMQIRYLETLIDMSKNSGNKVIFMPLDTDIDAAKVPKAKIMPA
jgi:regulator of protease activity HflC (stomatin/prohibitin superfamily)